MRPPIIFNELTKYVCWCVMYDWRIKKTEHRHSFKVNINKLLDLCILLFNVECEVDSVGITEVEVFNASVACM